MEAKTKKLLISKANEIKGIDSLSGLQKEIEPLMNNISKDECPNELRRLEIIIEQINGLLNDNSTKDSDKNLTHAKKEVSDILCDLLCV